MWLLRGFLKSIRGRSILTFVVMMGVFPLYQVAAQSIDLGFRESFAFEDDPSVDFQLPSEADPQSLDQLSEEGGQQSSVPSFAPTIRQQLAGVSRGGRAARFSQRVEAASRLSGSSGGVIADEGVFDGETEQDRPDGFRLGSLRLTPSFDAGLGWADNAEQAKGGRPDGFYSVDAAVGVTSDWDRHELGLELRGSLRAFFREPDNNQPVATAGGNLRFDLGELTTAELDGAYSFSREERSSAENEAATGRTNPVQGMSGRFSFSRQVALVQLRGGLGVERTAYGGRESGAQPRDNNVFDATLRTSFDNGAMFEPYLEGGFLYRKYDESCHGEPSCIDRTSRGYLVKTGLTVDRGPKLRGEFGVGYRAEYLNDNRLDALQGLVFDGAFVWSPTRRDTVTVSGATSFAGTNIDGASGSILYAGDVRYARQFTADLVGDVQLGYTYRTYQGIDLVEHEGTGSLGLAWAFSKDAALLSRYTFQAFGSSSSDSSYTSSLIEAGLRIRR
ncbi:outer membrane beta-barrel protein [Pseudovibrio japonicus]|nr:outer membrane beta-barrel protein [Pseudovibrio japonicus]